MLHSKRAECIGNFGVEEMGYDITKIRLLIFLSGMNETDFLRSVGLGSKTLIRWSIGTEIPRDDYVSWFAQKLGVPVSLLRYSAENTVGL